VAADWQLRTAKESITAIGGQLARRMPIVGDAVEGLLHTVVGRFVLTLSDRSRLVCVFRDTQVTRARLTMPDDSVQEAEVEVGSLLDKLTRAFRRRDDWEL
jgi:hypothetical protein